MNYKELINLNINNQTHAAAIGIPINIYKEILELDKSLTMNNANNKSKIQEFINRFKGKDIIPATAAILSLIYKHATVNSKSRVRQILLNIDEEKLKKLYKLLSKNIPFETHKRSKTTHVTTPEHDGINKEYITSKQTTTGKYKTDYKEIHTDTFKEIHTDRPDYNKRPEIGRANPYSFYPHKKPRLDDSIKNKPKKFNIEMKTIMEELTNDIKNHEAKLEDQESKAINYVKSLAQVLTAMTTDFKYQPKHTQLFEGLFPNLDSNLL